MTAAPNGEAHWRDGRDEHELDPDANRVAVDGLGDFDPLDAVDSRDPPPGSTPRGGRALFDLADVLRRAGLRVREVDGWQQRQRGGTGYGQADPIGIIVHHTASSSGWDGEPDVNYLAFECDVAPMSNLYLDRSGQWWVLAGGASNTNGTGGPWGPIPLDSANSRVIGIEAGNNGVGEPWPEVMQDSYVAGVAALADAYGIEAGNILSHQEWAPTRKVDPAGPSRFGSINGSHSWDMDRFRAAVNEARGDTGPVRHQRSRVRRRPTSTYVVQPGDSWWAIAERTMGDPTANWRALAGANGGPDRQLHPGDVLTIPGGGATKRPGTVPPFPGEAKLDDRGPVVLAWQKALIAHDVIADNAANHDSHYGDGMFEAVLRAPAVLGLVRRRRRGRQAHVGQAPRRRLTEGEGLEAGGPRPHTELPGPQRCKRSSATPRRHVAPPTRRDLLDRPRVAVGVLEVDERAPRLVVDRAHRHAVPGQFGVDRLDVGDDDLQRADRCLVTSDQPLPMAIEHAEPGGVTWTKRISSLTAWS